MRNLPNKQPNGPEPLIPKDENIQKTSIKGIIQTVTTEEDKSHENQ